MYSVVFRTIAECESKGAITWTTFESKEYFDKWYDANNMREWYEVVEKGVTEERAIELCSSPEAKFAVMSSIMRSISSATEKIDDLVKAIVD